MYVGPRLLVSRGPRDEETITALEREADASRLAGHRQQGPHGAARPEGRTSPTSSGRPWTATTTGSYFDEGETTAGGPARPRRSGQGGATTLPTAGCCSSARAPQAERPRRRPARRPRPRRAAPRRSDAEPLPTRPHPYDDPHPYEERPLGRRGRQLRRPRQRRSPADGVRRPAARCARPSVKGRRPVVATLDTGCGEHPWLDGVVRTDVEARHRPDRLRRRRDRSREVVRPVRRARRGHRPAGRPRHVHRRSDPPGVPRRRHRRLADRRLRRPVVESNLVKALEDIAELARRHRDGEPGGHPIDVLSLSLGYYHETPEDELFDPTMYGILRRARRVRRRRGLLRRQRRHRAPRLPRGLSRRGSTTAATVHAENGVVPIVSVGALNPNGTDALFSNTGPWVRAYARGAAVMSTIPPVPGGLQPDGQHRGRTGASASRSTPTTTAAVRPVERHVVRRTALRRAGWPPQLVGTIDPAHDDAGRRRRPRLGGGGCPDGHHAMMGECPPLPSCTGALSTCVNRTSSTARSRPARAGAADRRRPRPAGPDRPVARVRRRRDRRMRRGSRPLPRPSSADVASAR